jgi:CheY-like chemotaxis protein
MNLVLNAQYAIPGTGFITMETSCVSLDENVVHQFSKVRPGDYVQLTVSDSGHGMDSETMDHIFEPFYTTKGVGEGTGLGLSTVYGIVSQHEGSIRVHSEPGGGTVFKLFFPFVVDSPAQESQTAVTARSEGIDEGTILLVEDNEDVRRMVRDLLTDFGYHIIEADDPQKALVMAEGQEIDLVLSDVIMPGMSGPDMYQQLVRLHPGLKVLFMSGYTNNILEQFPELNEKGNFIQKPFDIATFKKRVAELLDKQ